MHKSIEAWVGSALLLSALLLFLSGMVFRGLSIDVSGDAITEVSIYLVVWGLLLSAAGCVAHREHIRADFFLRLTGQKLRAVAEVLASLSGLVFCAALTWYGWKVTEFAIAWDERSLSYLQLPMAWYYLALPISMAACTLRYMLELLSLARNGGRVSTGPETLAAGGTRPSAQTESEK